MAAPTTTPRTSTSVTPTGPPTCPPLRPSARRRARCPRTGPPSGEYGHFGENVTGLSPGRVHFFEVCGADVRPGAEEACGGVQSFFTKPTVAQDSVQGWLWAGSVPQFSDTFYIDAASGPQGQNVDGLFVERSRSGAKVADGRVTCLKVERRSRGGR